jgi:DNA-binding FadR family transcriptional regulator
VTVPLVREVDGPAFTTRMLEPVRSVNAFEETLERIMHMIKLGLVLPGDRLPAERELARRLQISRPTVSAAIRSLVQAGYLETRRGRHGGTFVIAWVPVPSDEGARAIIREMGDELTDALDLRRVVEPGAAVLAAERATTADHQRLDDALGLLAQAPRISFPATERGVLDGSGGVEPPLSLPSAAAVPALSYRFADRRLHLLIGELARSRSISRAVEDVQVRLSDLIAHTPQMEAALRHSDEQHERIVAAIKNGDPSGAREAMEEHVAATRSYVRGFLE